MDRSVQRRTKGFDETWTVSGREAKLNGWGELVLFHDDLERCTVTDLQAALRESCAEGEGLDVARITDVDYEFYDEDSSGSEAISFKLHNNALTILLSFVFSDEDDRNSCQVVRSTLSSRFCGGTAWRSLSADQESGSPRHPSSLSTPSSDSVRADERFVSSTTWAMTPWHSSMPSPVAS